MRILKDWLSRCNQNKTKTVAPHITNLMCSLVLLLTISIQLVASYSKCLTCLHASLYFILTHYICSLTENMSRKFREISRIQRDQLWRFLKRSLFFEDFKRQHKLVRDKKQGKLVPYFLNNTAKTYLHGLKISENIEIDHVFQSNAF